MTSHPDVFAALAAEFHPSDIKDRTGSGGRKLKYITAATACNRLDDVLGPESWDFEITPWGENALIGTITVRLPDGTVMRKSNVGGRADMQAADDDAKSAASDCLKRCATMLGVGRYLSGDGVPTYTQGRTPSVEAVVPPAVARRRDPGAPPAGRGDAYDDDVAEDRGGNGQARREPERPRQQPNGQGGNGQGHGGGNGPAPRNGRSLFAWAKKVEEERQVGLVRYLNGFMKLQELPSRMVELDEEQVALVYAEAVRKLSTLEGAA
jgi:hypothetical protein